MWQAWQNVANMFLATGNYFKLTYGKYFMREMENTQKMAENNYWGWSNDYWTLLTVSVGEL